MPAAAEVVYGRDLYVMFAQLLSLSVSLPLSLISVMCVFICRYSILGIYVPCSVSLGGVQRLEVDGTPLVRRGAAVIGMPGENNKEVN